MKKLKLLAVLLGLVTTSTAFAATSITSGGAGNSSLVFSSWDSSSSYTADLGYLLNTFGGADASGGSSASNTLTASNGVYTGHVGVDGVIADITLTGFNTSNSGSWNLVAVDTTGRKRVLFTEINSISAPLNSQITTAGTSFGSYLGALNGGAPTNFLSGGAGPTWTTALSTDAWYANSAIWGSNLGNSGINGTSASLGSSADLMIASQQSVAATNSGLDSALNYVTNQDGRRVEISTYLSGGSEHLLIAAVPETSPISMMLVGLGMIGLIARRKKNLTA